MRLPPPVFAGPNGLGTVSTCTPVDLIAPVLENGGHQSASPEHIHPVLEWTEHGSCLVRETGPAELASRSDRCSGRFRRTNKALHNHLERPFALFTESTYSLGLSLRKIPKLNGNCEPGQGAHASDYDSILGQRRYQRAWGAWIHFDSYQNSPQVITHFAVRLL